MSDPYAGNPANYPAEIDVPTDDDEAKAETWSVPYEQLADRTARLTARATTLIPVVQKITVTGTTWNAPANAVYHDVVLVGAGGNGGNGANNNGGGGGGSNGEVKERRFPAHASFASALVTLGAPGANQQSTFYSAGAAIYFAVGAGANGANQSGGTGGAGGTAGTGGGQSAGGKGGNTSNAGGKGGDGWTAEGVAGGSVAGSPNAPGAGRGYGAGGAGGYGSGTGGGGGGGASGYCIGDGASGEPAAGINGGAGAPSVCIVTSWCGSTAA